MGFLNKLQDRWKLKNITQVIIVLIVFACTGFTVMFLKKPIMEFILNTGDSQWFYTVLYYILILPVYFVILLFYGFVFGQSHFFWSFVKKTGNRMVGRKNNVNDAE